VLVAPLIAPLLLAIATPNWDLSPSGHYVEARTASVFAGACHYGGEATTAGREALLAWKLDQGRVSSVDLAGASIAAAIVDDRNLAEPASARRSVIYVDSRAPESVRVTLVEWLRASHADLLGQVLAVRSVPLDFDIGADAFRVDGGAAFLLRGAAMPDRACCKMPYNVWYSPFERVEDRLVGNGADFRFAEPLLDRTWSRPDENAAFLGRFGPSRVDTESRTPSACASSDATESLR
jgi:hypothetical protein